jgi:methyl-accepting chemotaxis protein
MPGVFVAGSLGIDRPGEEMTTNTIARKLAVSLAVMILGFLGCTSFILYTLNLLKVNGPVYKQIIAGKDLIADILPPPDYIIESYLVAFELRENIGNASEVDRLSDYMLGKLKKEYDERHQVWVRDSLYLSGEESIRVPMLEGSYLPAVEFYKVVESEYLPAVRAGDRALAERLVSGRLKELYAEHRRHIDTVVKLSTEKNARLEREASGLDRRNSTLSIALAALSVVLSLVLTVSLSRGIIRPLRSTVDMFRDLSGGEGDLTRRLEVNAKDEIGEMATHFNLTLDKIRKMVLSIRKETETLSQVSLELSSNMDETAASINEIGSNIQNVTQETGKQSASVAETGQAMQRITANITALNKHIEDQSASVIQSSAAVEEMLANIASVTHSLQKNSADMDELSGMSARSKSDLDEASINIREIAKESEALLEISDIIQDIASQTNLLAMNAAIEAAHAGESGRGFAVVADEIRKLAESSGSQAKTVSTVLAKMTDSMNQIRTSTDMLLGQYEEMDARIRLLSDRELGIKNAMDEQGSGSNEILSAIGQLTEITQKVQSGSEEMLVESGEVIRESENLGRMTEVVAGSMHEMAAGARQITVAVNAVNEISRQNKESIDSLLAEVMKFKV